MNFMFHNHDYIMHVVLIIAKDTLSLQKIYSISMLIVLRINSIGEGRLL